MKPFQRRAAICVALLLLVGGLSVASVAAFGANGDRATAKAIAGAKPRCDHYRVLGQVDLRSPRNRSHGPTGVAEVVRQYCHAQLSILAQGLKANTKHNAYAVWLYSGRKDMLLLGFVRPPVQKNGRLKTTGRVPRGWRHFHRLLISLETRADPARPHHIVLTGKLFHRDQSSGS